MRTFYKSIVISCILAILIIAAPASAEQGKFYRTFFQSGDIPSIDQALVGDQIGIQLVDELTVGLLRQNEVSGAIENGMAESFEVSADGRVYTFKIRQGVPWVRYNAETDAVEEALDCDGKVRIVTAADFAYGAERTLRAETASDYAYVAYAIEGAEAFNTPEEDKEPDFAAVGVKVIDDFTIEYTFVEPGVFNQNIISMWMLHAMPRWVIEGDACTEGVAERWTESETYQGYGPFTLKEWIHDSHLTILANPFWPGTEEIPAPTIAGVIIHIMDSSAGLSEYEAGNMDNAGITAADYDRIMTDPVLSAEVVDLKGDVGTEFLIFNPNLPPTDDVRVRKALAYAIDRDAVVATLKAGMTAKAFIHPGVTGAPVSDDPDFGASFDTGKARELIAGYCAEKGITPGDITVTVAYNTSESRKIYMELLQYMWSDSLGINVELKNSEWKVYKVEREEGTSNVYRSTWVQDYMDANNFTRDVFLCGASYQAVTDWPSVGCVERDDPLFREYEEVVLTAARELDPEKRVELYTRSDEILINEAAIVTPTYYYGGPFLRKPNIKAPESLTGYERWEKWTIE